MGGPDGKNPADAAIDWSLIFHDFASAYGYTWEQFTGLTFKMLNACLIAMGKRQHENIAMQAALHGIKLDRPEKQEKLTKKDNKIINDIIKKELDKKRDGKR